MLPPTGKADHDIVYIEYDIKAKRIEDLPLQASGYGWIWKFWSRQSQKWKDEKILVIY